MGRNMDYFGPWIYHLYLLMFKFIWFCNSSPLPHQIPKSLSSLAPSDCIFINLLKIFLIQNMPILFSVFKLFFYLLTFRRSIPSLILDIENVVKIRWHACIFIRWWALWNWTDSILFFFAENAMCTATFKSKRKGLTYLVLSILHLICIMWSINLSACLLLIPGTIINFPV